MNDFIKTSCKKIEKEFIEKILPIDYLSKGILVSEGFAFCALAKALEVDLIIESGICEGFSTSIWSKFFDSIPIIAVDCRLQENIIQKFNSNTNVKLVEGDSNHLLPKIVQEYSKRRIAIFIDGPKDMQAVLVANKCLYFENVALIGIHDFQKTLNNKTNEIRIFLDNFRLVDFYTDDQEFIERYSFMDNLVHYVTANGDKYWAPYCLMSKEHGQVSSFGSYGFTIAFIIRK